MIRELEGHDELKSKLYSLPDAGLLPRGVHIMQDLSRRDHL